MLIATIITYNDFPLIKDCVESVIDKVDKIIVIDGKYADFPDGSGFSTDGTIEYLESVDKVKLIMTSGLTEIEKRNLYLEPLTENDIVINLDSDEVLVGSLPKLTSDWGIIDLKDGHSKHIQRRASRFFKYRKGIKYQNTHCTLYYNGKIINKLHEVINKDFSFELIKGCYILHNWHNRNDRRKYDKSIYYRKLVKKESGFLK